MHSIHFKKPPTHAWFRMRALDFDNGMNKVEIYFDNVLLVSKKIEVLNSVDNDTQRQK